MAATSDNGAAMFADSQTRFGPTAADWDSGNNSDADLTPNQQAEGVTPDPRNHFEATPHDPTGAN